MPKIVKLSTRAALPVLFFLSATVAPTAFADDGALREGFERPSPDMIAETMFAERDLNEDGIIPLAEFTQEPTENFAEWDINQDGSLTLDEFPQDLPDSLRPMRRAHAGAADQTEGEQGEKRRGSRRAPSRMRIFSHLDQDGNEVLSLEEFLMPATRIFDKLDANENGDLTYDETVASLEAMQDQMGERRGKRRSRYRGAMER